MPSAAPAGDHGLNVTQWVNGIDPRGNPAHRTRRQAERADADRDAGLSRLRRGLAADLGRRVGLREAHRVLAARDRDGLGDARRRPRPRERPEPAERAADPHVPGARVALPVGRGRLPDGAGRGRRAAAGAGGRPDRLPRPERLAAARPRRRAGGGPAAGRAPRGGPHHRHTAQQAAGVRSVGVSRGVGGHSRRDVAEPPLRGAAGPDDLRARGGPLPDGGREPRVPDLDGRAAPRRAEREPPHAPWPT